MWLLVVSEKQNYIRKSADWHEQVGMEEVKHYDKDDDGYRIDNVRETISRALTASA